MIFDSKSKIIKFIFIVAVVITALNFVVDIYNTINFPGTDLRNRVVGARLALAGIDPYFFKWHPGLPEIFYDPMDNPEEILSKLSVPPTIIALHSPIAGLTYLQQKLVWLIIQWTTFAGIILIFFNSCKSQTRQNLILIIGFFFANGLFWKFHVNSGQIYIVYVGLLSVSWLFLNQKFKYSQAASGFFAGITASLRPPYILLFPLFLVRRQYLFVAGGIAGILSSILLSIAVTGTFIWRQYVLTMMGMTGFIDLQKIMPKPSAASIAEAANYSPVVEGIDFQIRNILEEYLLSESSLRGVLVALDMPNKKAILVVSFLITFAILFWFGVRYSLKQTNANLVFLASVVLCLVSEFFIPISRYSYYDVQWLLPLLIIVSLADNQKLLNSKLIWLLIIGLVLNVCQFTLFEHSLFFSTYFIASFVFFTTILLFRNNHLKPLNINAAGSASNF